MRKLLLVLLLSVFICTSAAAQGLSPKAGAVSEGLYSNLYFGVNYKLPQGWKVGYVAGEGECPRECLLLDARSPEKSKRGVSITAEVLTAGGAGHVALAGSSLEQAGARKLPPGREVSASGRKLYRDDYRSEVVGGELYHAIVMLPGRDYAIVFSFSAESRKQLDAIVDELPKALSFAGGSGGQ